MAQTMFEKVFCMALADRLVYSRPTFEAEYSGLHYYIWCIYLCLALILVVWRVAGNT